MTVRISEIKTASAATVIDLHIVERAGAAAISEALGADAIEDAVELRLIDFEGVVVPFESVPVWKSPPAVVTGTQAFP